MKLLPLFVIVGLVTSAAAAPDAKPSAKTAATAMPAAVERASTTFSADAVRAHTKFLSSDLLEGRGPGTRGDALAVAYIASQFEAAGLEPAGDNGTYLQKVPLIGVTLDADKSSVAFARNGSSAGRTLAFLDEFVGSDSSQSETSTIDSEVVFVGHGVTAPEYRWDDLKSADLAGKTLVMLVNDPPATAGEPELFKGRTRTYYGRWTYKFEQGAAQRAAAVILIHSDEAAGYGWGVVKNSWGREQSSPRVAPGAPALRFAGWVTESVAKDLFASAGHDLDALIKAAGSRDFKPVPMGLRLRANLVSTIRPFDTHNVVARMRGSDPRLTEEAVLYTAHHDHLGIGTADESGDTIYNGAVDNATGTALLIEMARVWSRSNPKPKRSVMFAAVAAEEQGLLGSEWLAANPPLPSGRIALTINYDAIHQTGRVRDVTLLGVERTTFEPVARRVSTALGLTIVPDQSPEQGSYYRSDHFSLAKTGVPAFSVGRGRQVIDKPEAWAKQVSDDYRKNRYHQPADEYDPSWDFSASAQMAQLGFWLGWEAANAAQMPHWLEGEEFRAAREKALGK